MRKNHSIQVKLATPIIFIAVIVLGSMTFFMAKQSNQMATNDATEKLVAMARGSSNELRLEVEKGLSVARNIAHTVESLKESGHTNRQHVAESIRDSLIKNKFLVGTWTGWEQNAWDGKDGEFANSSGHDATGRFVPYANWEGGKASVTPLIGYTNPGEGDYYLVPKTRLKETMVEPYLYPIDGVQVLMTSAAVPIMMNGKFVGAAGVDLPLKEIQKKVGAIRPYKTSQAYLVTTSGNYVSHPEEKLITKPADFPFEAGKFKDAISTGKEVVISGVDPADGAEYLYVVSPMMLGDTEQPWALIVKTPTKTVLAAATEMLWTQIIIAITGILILFAAVVLIAKYISKSVSSLSAQLNSSSEQVSSAINQLTIAGQSLSSSSSESAAALEETVASLEEMSSMVKLNSDNAKQAATLSLSSSELAVNGEKEMESLISSMNVISNTSKQIEEIINVIDDIAFQTNLLALNASVEAARAGDHGKGFAVVAEAVRSLAHRSASAAKDISTLITDSVEKIEDGAKKSAKSGDMLKEIVKSVKKVSELNNEISMASEEQSTGIAQISKAMNQLDQAVQSNAASSEEIAGTAEEINSQAKIMNGVVEELNLVVYGDAVQRQQAEVVPLNRGFKTSTKAA
ncbi:methyl-accepting chemotaxis protein [Bdellovibrio reynosensis]|uniref:Methyl-accepting chemotaxis protein n=1 Tax=Bdellovibrio reynosensis TaxID=2835041 RepID=A0ABY4CD51_9BACT|nr:methyl-accepting chemotaxis protein [Bdellovibrio reynosensis]UOF02763.1 methyl-accepting chemotaxis protein [Bdellovibrio reynosensis]